MAVVGVSAGEGSWMRGLITGLGMKPGKVVGVPMRMFPRPPGRRGVIWAEAAPAKSAVAKAAIRVFFFTPTVYARP